MRMKKKKYMYGLFWKVTTGVWLPIKHDQHPQMLVCTQSLKRAWHIPFACCFTEIIDHKIEFHSSPTNIRSRRKAILPNMLLCDVFEYLLPVGATIVCFLSQPGENVIRFSIVCHYAQCLKTVVYTIHVLPVLLKLWHTNYENCPKYSQ